MKAEIIRDGRFAHKPSKKATVRIVVVTVKKQFNTKESTND